MESLPVEILVPCWHSPSAHVNLEHGCSSKISLQDFPHTKLCWLLDHDMHECRIRPR